MVRSRSLELRPAPVRFGAPRSFGRLVTGKVWVFPGPCCCADLPRAAGRFQSPVLSSLAWRRRLPRAFPSSSERSAPLSARCRLTENLAIPGASASAFHGVLAFPLRDLSRRRPLNDRASQARSNIPSTAFLTLSTAYSATGLAGLFHPAATSRVLPFRGLFLTRKPPRISATVALCSLDSSDCSRLRRRNCPEIQGFALPNECGGDRNR
jgi:hypothetical protein